jgi:hypothetical protein
MGRHRSIKSARDFGCAARNDGWSGGIESSACLGIIIMLQSDGDHITAERGGFKNRAGFNRSHCRSIFYPPHDVQQYFCAVFHARRRRDDQKRRSAQRLMRNVWQWLLVASGNTSKYLGL